MNKKIFILTLLFMFLTTMTISFDLSNTDFLTDSGSPRIRSVVVGHNAGTQDYLNGARLAVKLTAMAAQKTEITLMCSENKKTTHWLFTPAKREVLLYRDTDNALEPMLVVGGHMANLIAARHSDIISNDLKGPGDKMARRIGNNIFIAGYTGDDTQNVVDQLIIFLEGI